MRQEASAAESVATCRMGHIGHVGSGSRNVRKIHFESNRVFSRGWECSTLNRIIMFFLAVGWLRGVGHSHTLSGNPGKCAEHRRALHLTCLTNSAGVTPAMLGDLNYGVVASFVLSSTATSGLLKMSACSQVLCRPNETQDRGIVAGVDAVFWATGPRQVRRTAVCEISVDGLVGLGVLIRMNAWLLFAKNPLAWRDVCACGEGVMGHACAGVLCVKSRTPFNIETFSPKRVLHHMFLHAPGRRLRGPGGAATAKVSTSCQVPPFFPGLFGRDACNCASSVVVLCA